MCATDSTPWAYWAVNHFSPPWFHRPFYPVLLEKLSARDYNLKDSHWLSCSSIALICSDCQQIIFLSEVPSIHTSFAFLVLKVLWERSKALSFLSPKGTFLTITVQITQMTAWNNNYSFQCLYLLHLLCCLLPCVSAPSASSPMLVTYFPIYFQSVDISQGL